LVLCPSSPISHSRSFDHRRFARLPLTAIASAFRCPTSTTIHLQGDAEQLGVGLGIRCLDRTPQIGILPPTAGDLGQPD
jgi:hypothetical protein